MTREPRLLIEWEPRWRGLLTGIRPALAPAGQRFPGEVRDGGISGSSALLSLLLNAAFVTLALVGPQLAPRAAVVALRAQSNDDVLYYAPALPQIEDAGGASKGISGAAGGHTGFHPGQEVRVTQRPFATAQAVDAPKLQLRADHQPLADAIALAHVSIPEQLQAVVRNTPQIASAPEVQAHTDVSIPSPNLPALVAPVTRSLHKKETVAAPEVNARTDIAIPTVTMPALAEQPIARAMGRRRGLQDEVAPQVSDTNLHPTLTVPVGAPGIALAAPTIARARGDRRGLILPQSDGALPPSTGRDGGSPLGTAGNHSVVLSSAPGSAVGRSDSLASSGSFAGSPHGTDIDLNGTGNGSGIARGNGTGSGTTGTGTGAATKGIGVGSSVATGGTSTSPGPGGSGENGSQMSGVTVRGGTVTIGSFAASPTTVTPSGNKPLGPRRPPNVVIVGTSRSGGGLNAYGLLKGDRVYTIYLDTQIGTAVLQFAASQPATPTSRDLTAPDPLALALPEGAQKVRMMVSCVIDQLGAVRDLKILQSGDDAAIVPLLAAIKAWRFRPALSGDNPVAVNAVLGFGVQTQ